VASERLRFRFGTAADWGGAMVGLSKILDYLVDKLYANMLSPMKKWGQAESGRTEAPLPDLGTTVAASTGRRPEKRLTESLTALGQDMEIIVRPTRR
jgi:hypothetical protein